ncbi:MAG: DNA repair protein RecN [Acidimicrobiales bacterium]
MLVELRVSQLGLIDDVNLVLGPGLTVLTGETGAGKTLLVDAIHLLLGGNPDPALVRTGAAEALVEGRFAEAAGGETVLCRVVPAAGRTRAYLDGRMVSAAQLAGAGEALVDLHGQHSHQSLLSTPGQRAALDAAGALDAREVSEGRRRLAALVAARDSTGGDARSRARELDLLRYQLGELQAARLEDSAEDEVLAAEEEVLADAAGLRDAANQTWRALVDDDGVVDRLGSLVGVMSSRRPLAALHARLQVLQSEVSDLAGEARSVAEAVEDDPARLSLVVSRRQALHDLKRKYGDTVGDVIAFRDSVVERLAELESRDERLASLDREVADAAASLRAAEERLWAARRDVAPVLARSIEARLHELAIPKARFDVEVGAEPPGDAVVWKLGANPGEPVLPLSKVASGGELARTMLAARLAVAGGSRSGAGHLVATANGAAAVDGPSGPSTLVFDEVDAGIGGVAAVAVGEALADLGAHHQVLVVTHLAQVAARADRHLVVRKATVGGRTTARVVGVEGQDRVVEVSRMLSGSPGSETASSHAEELLASGRRRPLRPGRVLAATAGANRPARS